MALAAGAIGLASAQVSGPYTDPQNGIAYQQFYTPVAGGYSFAMALPTNPTNEFIGKLVRRSSSLPCGSCLTVRLTRT